MPSYSYICDYCCNATEITHGMDEKLEICPHCQTDKHIRKVPSQITLMKNRVTVASAEKPGEVVKDSIKEIQNDVNAEREALKKRVFLPPGQK